MIFTQECLALLGTVLGLGGKLYTEEPWHSGPRAIALGQLTFLSRIYQFSQMKPTDYSIAGPGTQLLPRRPAHPALLALVLILLIGS